MPQRPELVYIYTGVSSQSPIPTQEIEAHWRAAILWLASFDPDLARQINLQQQPTVVDRDGQYMAVVSMPMQAALFGSTGRALDLERGLSVEADALGRRIISAAQEVAARTPEIAAIIESDPDPLGRIEALELAPKSLMSLVDRVVRGHPAMTVVSARGDEVTVPPSGGGVRRSVLGEPCEVHVRVTDQLSASSFRLRLTRVDRGVRALRAGMVLTVLVPAPLSTAVVLLSAARHVDRELRLVVTPRISIRRRRALDVMLGGVPDWPAGLAEMVQRLPAPPTLSVADIAEIVAGWRDAQVSEDLDPPDPSNVSS